MTQEEKAKRYDELLLKLQKAKVDDNVCDEMYYRVIDDIVPELAKSEDERIRKAIHIYFDWLDGRKDYAPKGKYTIRDMIAWLEKQGEQKQDPCEHCDDKRLNCHNFPCTKKKAFKQGKSVLEAIIDEKVDNANKVEQNPAWSEEDERQWNNIYDVLDGHFELSKKGYKNAANWFKAIKGRVQPQPKQEWSKDDKVMLDDIIDFFENGTVKLQHDLSLYASWLKSLKNRIGCEANCTTTKEWRASWEQLDALQYVCRNFNPPLTDKLGWDSIKTLESLYQDLKKLK